MRDGLKIYACSGFGIGTTPDKFDYWRDNTETIKNTCAVNSLLADINLLAVKLQYEDLSEKDVLLALNLIDLYTVCLYAAENYSGDELQAYGTIIGWMAENGAFSSASLDNDERDENLDQLIAVSQDYFYSGEYEQIANETTVWFTEHVVLKDYVGLTERQIDAVESALSIGVSGDKDAGSALYEQGGYYLYLYLGEAQARKMGKTIYQKYLKEKEVYEYVHKAYDDIYGGKEAVDKVIYAGITSTYKMTPERIVEKLTRGGKAESIGDFGVSEIIAIIVAVVNIIIAVVSLVMSIVGACLESKYAEPTDPDFGTPGVDGEDISEIKNYNGKSSLLGKLGIAGGVLLLLYGLFN